MALPKFLWRLFAAGPSSSSQSSSRHDSRLLSSDTLKAASEEKWEQPEESFPDIEADLSLEPEEVISKTSLVHRLRHIRHPRLRLYQQIIICFVAMVLIPLLGVSFIIHSINQKALKKEIAKFTEHTAGALYEDLQRDMSWQKDLMSTANATFQFFVRSSSSKKGVKPHTATRYALKMLLPTIKRLNQAGLYSSQGRLLDSVGKVSAAMAPPLPQKMVFKNTSVPFYELVSFQKLASDTSPEKATYWLRGCLPTHTLWKTETTGAMLCLQLPFDAFTQLISSKETGVFQSVYLVNAEGLVVATSEKQAVSPHPLPYTQLKRFKTLAPGILKQTEVPSDQALQFRPEASQKPVPAEEDLENIKPIRAIMVKIPDIHWGIVIESPYEIKQHFIRRARDQSLFLILGSLVVVVLLVLVYVLGISRNFRQLIKGTQAMAAGNYKRRIRLITHAWTPYEILYLTLEFNRMARKTADAWDNSQRLTQQLSKLDELKSNLIDTVSHELRTPLTSIKGYTSRLLRYDTTLDPEIRRQSLKAVKEQADRLTRLVEDLLVIPDLENSALRVYPDTILLQPIVERCLATIQQKDTTREFILTPSSTSTWETLQVFVDPDRLEQVLLNLLDNALKYSLPQTPIYLNIQENLPSENTVTLHVSNASEPIDPEVLPTLTEKFKRLDDQLTRTTRGTGLGLFIAQQLIEAMAGTLTLSYQPGALSGLFTASIYVPMEMAAEEIPASPDESLKPSGAKP